MVISKKKKKLLPSFINKHKSSTRGLESEKEGKKYRVWFRVYFDPILWILSKQQYFITPTLAPRVANWPPKLIGILFFTS
jgi:hypothetical protein